MNDPQRGAALVVGLVLLLILTVLGIAGMSVATLELSMANNAQARELAFQAAETGLEVALSGPLDPAAPVLYADQPLASGSEFDARVICTGTSRVPGGIDGNAIDVRAIHFEATATGKGPRNAASVHTQGFYLLAPAAPENPDPEAPAAVNDCAGILPCLGLRCFTSDPTLPPVRTYWREGSVD